MRIVLVKPDWHIRGGAEIVIDRLEGMLTSDGHRVLRQSIAIPLLPKRAYGLPIPSRVWDQAPEYFRYLATLEAVEQVDVSGADLVISTQPPSWGVHHRRHLSIFFHHLRVFYDLEEVYLQAGLAGSPELHAAARRRIRDLDQRRMETVTWFCANSEVTAGRLASFNGLTNSSVHHAGVGVGSEHPVKQVAAPGRGEVLCVSRSEFTKRTELFVHAMKFLPRERGCLIGTGGRLGWVRGLDAQLSSRGASPDALTATDLWLNRGEGANGGLGGGRSNVSFVGRVKDGELLRRYSRAACVVAPAFDEDYGLTALEAMAHGRPVICCSDGGGLTLFVRDGENGFVVEPTGRAIAEAVGRIVDEPELARRLGEEARRTAASYTWERCADELRTAIDRVMAV